MNRFNVSAHTKAQAQVNADADAYPRSRQVAVRRSAAMVMTTLLAVCAACVFATGPSLAADNAKVAPRPAMTVTTAKPAAGSLPIRLAANGNIAAWQEAVIGSEANGLRLTDVLVNVGDLVKAGQVLARFSADSLRAELAQGRASVLEAKANAADAKANADRARSLQATGALSVQQINQYATTEQTARAKVAAARAVLQVQQLRLNQTQVLAPDSGVISSRTATVGSVVGAGTELFKLVRKGRLEWRAEVTATELGRIQPGTPVDLVAASGAKLQGTVRNMAPTVDPLTRNALVYVDFPNATPTLQKTTEKNTSMPNVGGPPVLPGMFARGEFVLGSSQALTLPQQSLVVRDGFTYIFLVGTDQRVTQRKVDVGRRMGEQVEILSGVEPQATVAVRGAGFLNEGDTVRVVNEAAPSPAAASSVAPAAGTAR